MTAPAFRFSSVVFDADSTLADLEGIDWLAQRRDATVAADVESLTHRAMNGELPLDAVYAERIARIRPTTSELDALGDEYVRRAVAGARELLGELHAAGVATFIVSGGIRAALLPLAAHLGVPAAHVHAVTLRASNGDTVFDTLDGPQPLATQEGKITVVQQLRDAGVLPVPVAFVGDGSTDAAVRSLVDCFVAFTQVARRPAVVAVAHAEAESMTALRRLLRVARIGVPWQIAP